MPCDAPALQRVLPISPSHSSPLRCRQINGEWSRRTGSKTPGSLSIIEWVFTTATDGATRLDGRVDTNSLGSFVVSGNYTPRGLSNFDLTLDDSDGGGTSKESFLKSIPIIGGACAQLSTHADLELRAL